MSIARDLNRLARDRTRKRNLRRAHRTSKAKLTQRQRPR